jgi:RimJ/RimL family protein N-acetyltransferase
MIDLTFSLVAETWPFHARARWSPDEALAAVRSGDFTADNPTYWATLEGAGHVGIVHFRYLTDVSPDVDFRLLAPFRGRGLGTLMARWAPGHLFATTDRHRLAGETRVDNVAMRRVFERCGWTEEAHYRQSWPTEDGGWTDSVGYAIVRDDMLVRRGD